jgi:AraC family transcriptional regulator of adaptative response/methylated-DNA-[protein]-cysteine methyltransferase
VKHVPAPISTMPGEQEMRSAVANRDPLFDGKFVYGVLTTGVYCRPSCASRAARPANIRYFPNEAVAEAAGLRACKRCRPNASAARHVDLMQELARFIDKHAEQPLSLKKLAHEAQLSSAYLQKTFKRILGVSPKAYHDAARMRLLKGALRSGRGVLESITEAGFQSTSRVYERAARNLGMTPSAYRSGGTDETISYAFRNTTLGPLLMAATQRGVCFAQFGESEDSLVEQLKAEFPKAIVQESQATQSPDLDTWMRALDQHIGGNTTLPKMPLDLRGTAFQIRVWRFLLEVPEGDVVSYKEVATGIGAANAVRATASACAANRIAVLVPCHRVLRGDGGVGGYRWGLERKRALLDQERTRRAS